MDSLHGPNNSATWQITGPNQGTVGAFQFTSVASLLGGTGVDSFRFNAGSSLSGKLDGGGGDWLVYINWINPVVVDLSSGSAKDVANGIGNIQNVIANTCTGPVNLIGNDQGNILVGGTGTNLLADGNDRSLLIGGKGAHTISGGSGDDILIAGNTIYDASQDALTAIFKEWQRTDLVGTAQQVYGQRIQNLQTGTGLSGPFKLNWGASAFDSDVASAPNDRRQRAGLVLRQRERPRYPGRHYGLKLRRPRKSKLVRRQGLNLGFQSPSASEVSFGTPRWRFLKARILPQRGPTNQPRAERSGTPRSAALG